MGVRPFCPAGIYQVGETRASPARSSDPEIHCQTIELDRLERITSVMRQLPIPPAFRLDEFDPTVRFPNISGLSSFHALRLAACHENQGRFLPAC
jgi:hypothetical protein